MEATNTLGARIREARRSARLTQIELCDIINVEQTTLSKWERGVGAGPRLSDGVRIADATGVGLLWLATGIGAGPQPKTEAA